jgi:hypothetical protein
MKEKGGKEKENVLMVVWKREERKVALFEGMNSNNSLLCSATIS